MAAEAKEPETVEHFVGIVEEIGDENHEPAAVHLGGDLLENLPGARLAGRPMRFERAQDLEDVPALRARRHERFYLVRKGRDARGVLLLENQISERGGENRRILELRDTVRSVVHRGAAVEDQRRAEVRTVSRS